MKLVSTASVLSLRLRLLQRLLVFITLPPGALGLVTFFRYMHAHNVKKKKLLFV